LEPNWYFVPSVSVMDPAMKMENCFPTA
jgi:hypothetical protein